MSNIPEDIQLEILLRVEVKSTFVCKCVCKNWFHIISNPSFVKNHLNLSTERNNGRLIIESDNGYRFYSASYDSLSPSLNKSDPAAVVDMDFPYKSLNHEIKLLSSCNGLIYGWNDKLHSFFLWNPATKEYKILPIPHYGFNGFHGFGYDCKMDDYKVVVVIYNRDSNEGSAVQVYSLKSNSWKSLQPIKKYVFNFNKGLQFNGALHWLATNVMVSFNMSEDRFEEVQLPMPLPFNGMIGLLKGCLCIIGRNGKKRREVWAMQDHGVSESWTKLKIIQLFKDVSMNFIGSLKNADNPFKDRITRDIYLYDLEYETAGKGKICGFYMIEAVNYYESLVSLNSSAAVATSGNTEITRKSKKKKSKKRKR